MADYPGKAVIVTGVASGMGYATAQQLLELGAAVYGIDFRPSTLPFAGFCQTDLRDPQQIAATSAKIECAVHALFNCAGLSEMSSARPDGQLLKRTAI